MSFNHLNDDTSLPNKILNFEEVAIKPMKINSNDKLSKSYYDGDSFSKGRNQFNNDVLDNDISKNNNNTIVNKDPRQIYQEKANREHVLEKKIREVNLQINKLKDENIKVSKLREEYEKLTNKLQKDMKEFNIKKELEKEQFLNWKNEEIRTINRDREILGREQKLFNNSKSKSSFITSSSSNTISNNNNACNEIIDSYKNRINVLIDKSKQDKQIIDSLTKQLDFQGKNIDPPQMKLQKYFKKYDNNELYGLLVSFDFIINDEYLKQSDIVKEEKKDEKKIITFANGKYQIVFQSGIKRDLFKDGHQIIYFPNGDINQIFTDGKEVFYFNENKTIQTKFNDGTIVLKFANGQIEKHYNDNNKQVFLSDGTITYVTSDGYEETYFSNEDIRITDLKENTVITYKKEWKMDIAKMIGN